MTAIPSIDLPACMAEQLVSGRVRTCCGRWSRSFVEALMSAEADAVCGAPLRAAQP